MLYTSRLFIFIVSFHSNHCLMNKLSLSVCFKWGNLISKIVCPWLFKWICCIEKGTETKVILPHILTFPFNYVLLCENVKCDGKNTQKVSCHPSSDIFYVLLWRNNFLPTISFLSDLFWFWVSHLHIHSAHLH